MTARFGRNKRRAAREAVAKAQASEAFTRDFYSKRLREAERATWEARYLMGDIVERIARVLGPESGLIPLALQDTLKLGTPIRWPVRHGRDIDNMRFSEDTLALAGVSERNYVDLLNLILTVETQPDPFRYIIRFVNESPVQGFTQRAFACSPEYIKEIGWMSSDNRYFAEEVVHQMEGVKSPEQQRAAREARFG